MIFCWLLYHSTGICSEQSEGVNELRLIFYNSIAQTQLPSIHRDMLYKHMLNCCFSSLEGKCCLLKIFLTRRPQVLLKSATKYANLWKPFESSHVNSITQLSCWCPMWQTTKSVFSQISMNSKDIILLKPITAQLYPGQMKNNGKNRTSMDQA